MSTDTDSQEKRCCWLPAGSRWLTAFSHQLAAIFPSGAMPPAPQTMKLWRVAGGEQRGIRRWPTASSQQLAANS
ncbi:MAG: hypothetical protein R3E79_37925 [Caldilineaceae bacterium]